MPRDPDLHIFLAICRPTPPSTTGRWLLILSPSLGDPDLETSCITYQTQRLPLPEGPGPWRSLKESDQGFSYPDVTTRYRLGTIRESEVWMVDEAARGAEPSVGRQKFIVGMVRLLEEQGVVDKGAGDFYEKLVDEK
jgi:hypothetical protein